jgi:hypothetical protein
MKSLEIKSKFQISNKDGMNGQVLESITKSLGRSSRKLRNLNNRKLKNLEKIEQTTK